MFEYSKDESGQLIYASSGQKVGRPEIEVDLDLLEKLAEIQCTKKEIAYCLGISIDTLMRRFADYIDKGQSMGRMRLRRAMWVNAIDKENTVMQIFLSKNILGYKDVPDAEDDDNKPLPWTAPVAPVEHKEVTNNENV
jgi:hypothetical protein